MSKLLALLLLFVVKASLALPSVIQVDGKASGGFGFDGGAGANPAAFANLVQGPMLTASQTVQISATGSVSADETNATLSLPDGLAFTFFANSFLTPLDEANGLSFSATVDNALALMAVFVPTANLPVTRPFSVNRGGDLSPAGLFFVGSSLRFSTPEAGQLFFGINDMRPGNNTGSYEVSVSAVPEPHAALLLLAGLTVLVPLARRSRKNA